MAQAHNVSSAADRPVSPHLQIWRWHVTMAVSILNRITGVGLALGTLAVVAWLAALAAGPIYFGPIDQFAHSLLGQLMLYALVAALGFHLCGGIRHLVMDAGLGFKRPSANLTSWLCILGMIAAPVALWFGLLAVG